MKSFFAALFLVFASLFAHASTVNVTASQSETAIQSSIAAAKVGDSVVFAAGTYNLATSLNLTCGVIYTGPVTNPSTAVLTTATQNITLLSLTGCASPTVVTNLNFKNAGVLYVNGSDTGLTFTNNTVTGLPSGESCTVCSTAVYFDGSISTVVSNVTITHNVIGDPTSCTAAFAVTSEMGGYCSALLIHVGVVNNLVVQYNSLLHLEEPVHIFQVTNYAVGAVSTYCNSCNISYNYFLNHHRIATELQMGVVGSGTVFQHNVVQDPLNPYYGTYALSFACCQFTSIAGTNTTVNPALLVDDNVLISSTAKVANAPYGIELWGTNVIASNTIIQGAFCNGITWGFLAGVNTLYNNTLQGAPMATGGCGGYITNQQGGLVPPVQANNVTGTTPIAKTSAAPTLTVSTAAVTISVGTNETAYYTTDGSTPTVASTPYVAPFTPAAGSTVKVIGQWGVAPLPKSFPAGYGYVPSAVQTATFVGQPVVVTPPPPPIPFGTYTVVVGSNGITITKQ